MTTTHAHQPTPTEVVTAALATRPPCPACGKTVPCRCYVPDPGRVEAQAALVVAALIEHGHLPDPTHPAETTLGEVEDVARWLANRSRFARYTTPGGWNRIMASEVDVNVAATKAHREAPSDGERQAVLEAKAVLLHWHGTHPDDQ